MVASMAATYHHGNLRAEVIEVAARIVAMRGVDALSMRELAREAGVSHGAPAHHFGDRRGLLTALAADGFGRLADALESAVTAGDIARARVAYVRYAADTRG